MEHTAVVARGWRRRRECPRRPITARSGCLPARFPRSVPRSEPRVVHQDGLGAHQDGVDPAAEPVVVRQGFRAGDPLAGAVVGRDAAVQGLGDVQRHEGPLGSDRSRTTGGSARTLARAASPLRTLTPAFRSVAAPPAAGSWGSSTAYTTSVMPASMIAWAHGPVRPQWLQGSSVTTMVAAVQVEAGFMPPGRWRRPPRGRSRRRGGIRSPGAGRLIRRRRRPPGDLRRADPQGCVEGGLHGGSRRAERRHIFAGPVNGSGSAGHGLVSAWIGRQSLARGSCRSFPREPRRLRGYTTAQYRTARRALQIQLYVLLSSRL